MTGSICYYVFTKIGVVGALRAVYLILPNYLSYHLTDDATIAYYVRTLPTRSSLARTPSYPNCSGRGNPPTLPSLSSDEPECYNNPVVFHKSNFVRTIAITFVQVFSVDKL